MHFWPISDWVFISPLSYWDSRAHADIIGPAALMLTLALTYLLVRRYSSWALRAFFALLAMLELASSGIWRLVF